MHKSLVFVLLLALSGIANAQDEKQNSATPLRPFTKVIASPRVNVVLVKGEKESIRLTYNNVSPEKVIAVVTGNKLRIYLDKARIVEKQEKIRCDLHGHRHGLHKRSIYHDVSVTAYVTYRELKEIEIRGEQELTVEDEINSQKLKIRAYGENEITLASLNTDKFKVSLYGENKLTIRAGETGHQVYRLFGENKIDTRGLKSVSASTRIYGEGKLSLSASRQLVVNAFGEPNILVSGSPHVNKGIVLGHANIDFQ